MLGVARAQSIPMPRQNLLSIEKALQREGFCRASPGRNSRRIWQNDLITGQDYCQNPGDCLGDYGDYFGDWTQQFILIHEI